MRSFIESGHKTNKLKAARKVGFAILCHYRYYRLSKIKSSISDFLRKIGKHETTPRKQFMY